MGVIDIIMEEFLRCGVSNFLIYILEFQVKGIYLVIVIQNVQTCGRQTFM